MTHLVLVGRRAGRAARALFARLGIEVPAPPRDTIAYEITRPAPLSRSTPLARCVLTYDALSLLREERSDSDARTQTSITLPLLDGYALTLVFERCPALSGFALKASRLGSDGFSWNWFSRQEPGFFAGRPGRLAVALARRPDTEDIQSILFTSDTSIRFSTSGTELELTVHAGSAFRFIS